jgi:hypothetical protein
MLTSSLHGHLHAPTALRSQPESVEKEKNLLLLLKLNPDSSVIQPLTRCVATGNSSILIWKYNKTLNMKENLI